MVAHVYCCSEDVPHAALVVIIRLCFNRINNSVKRMPSFMSNMKLVGLTASDVG